MEPYFSIIIPSHCRPQLLLKALESLQAQTFTDFEAVVVHSGESKYEAVKTTYKHDCKFVFRSLETIDRSTLRNRGIYLSKGKFICFMDDDDTVSPCFLQDFYDYRTQHRDGFSVLRTGYKVIGGKRRKKSEQFMPHRHRNPVYFAANYMMGVWSLCIPRAYLLEDLFPEKFPYWQDTHLILRLLARHPFVQLNNYNYQYHLHGNQSSQDAIDPRHTEEKLATNMEAIGDLFGRYGDLVSPFLPDNQEHKIIAGKYLHYASGVMERGKKKLGMQYFMTSVKMGVYRRYWRYYVSIARRLIFK